MVVGYYAWVCIGVVGYPLAQSQMLGEPKCSYTAVGCLVQVATGSSPAFLAATVLGFAASLARVAFVKEVEWCLNLLKYFSILPVH